MRGIEEISVCILGLSGGNNRARHERDDVTLCISVYTSGLYSIVGKGDDEGRRVKLIDDDQSQILYFFLAQCCFRSVQCVTSTIRLPSL